MHLTSLITNLTFGRLHAEGDGANKQRQTHIFVQLFFPLRHLDMIQSEQQMCIDDITTDPL